jgi:hypothetical protein
MREQLSAKFDGADSLQSFSVALGFSSAVNHREVEDKPQRSAEVFAEDAEQL